MNQEISLKSFAPKVSQLATDQNVLRVEFPFTGWIL